MGLRYGRAASSPDEVFILETPDLLGVVRWEVWYLAADGTPTDPTAAAVYVAEGFDPEDHRVVREEGVTTRGLEEKGNEDLIQGLDNYEDGQPAAIIELTEPIELSRFTGECDSSDQRRVRDIEVRCYGPGFSCAKRAGGDYFLDCFVEGGGEVHLWSRDSRWSGLEPRAPLGAPLRFALPAPGSRARPGNAREEDVRSLQIRADGVRSGDFLFEDDRLIGRIEDVRYTVGDGVELHIKGMTDQLRVLELSRDAVIDVERFG
ncbi:MAG: hypothetical protein ACR2KQ_03085 [Actinomycetota bacterium]